MPEQEQISSSADPETTLTMPPSQGQEENRPEPRTEARAEMKRTTEEALLQFQEVLAGFEDYSLFGSAAVYLRKRMAGEEADLPGDIDLICPDESALQMVKQRLARLPNITINLQPDGSFFTFPGQLDAKFFSGSVRIGETDVPFECFSEKRIAGARDVYAHRSRIQGGLMVLTGEGLKNQYLHTLEMDERIDRAVKNVLINIGRDLRSTTTSLEEIAKERDVSQEDLSWLLAQIKQAPLLVLFHDPDFTQEAARRFAGIKTKTERRRENVESLYGNSVELGETSNSLEEAA